MITERLLGVLTLGLGLTVGLVWVLGGGPPSALAANAIVNTTADELNSDGDCSLREAIQAANLGTTVDNCAGDAGPDTINLPAGVYTLTIAGADENANATGDLDITSAQALTIAGAGAGQTIINANGIDRAMDIHPGPGTVAISGVTVMGGSVTGLGGGVYADANRMFLLVNSIVVSNTATDGGGVYICGGGLLSGVRVAGNVASEWGGGVYDCGLASLNGLTAISNTAQYGGGALVGSGATMTDAQVLSNTASYGGGVYVAAAAGPVAVSGGLIAYNSAVNGGGVDVYGGPATFYGTEIRANHAARGGGMTVEHNGRATLDGAQIVGNSAQSGGGLCVGYSTSSLTQTGASLIAYNVATGTASTDGGGGIYVYGGRATLLNGQIISNTANRGGGVDVYGYYDALFAQAGGSIAYNVAAGTPAAGGGVYVRRGSALLSGGQIVSNTAGYEGGGVYIDQATAIVTQTGHRLAYNAAGTCGGGVLVNQGRLTSIGSRIHGNYISDDGDGGGLCIAQGSATLLDTHVTTNTAVGEGFGGGVYVGVSGGTFSMTGGVLRANDGSEGGGLNMQGGDVDLNRVLVANNTAANGGGGFHVSGGTLTLVNVTVSGNGATTSGGGLYVSGGTSAVTYTTVASNTAATGGGGIHKIAGVVQAQNTLVAGNGITNCNAALTSNGYNLDSGNTCGFGAGTDKPNTNPLLGPLNYDGGTWVHPLLDGSPAIDNGICVASITTDQRGVTRPQGSGCDIGAYEWEWLRVCLPLVLRSHP